MLCFLLHYYYISIMLCLLLHYYSVTIAVFYYITIMLCFLLYYYYISITLYLPTSRLMVTQLLDFNLSEYIYTYKAYVYDSSEGRILTVDGVYGFTLSEEVYRDSV